MGFFSRSLWASGHRGHQLKTRNANVKRQKNDHSNLCARVVLIHRAPSALLILLMRFAIGVRCKQTIYSCLFRCRMNFVINFGAWIFTPVSDASSTSKSRASHCSRLPMWMVPHRQNVYLFPTETIHNFAATRLLLPRVELAAIPRMWKTSCCSCGCFGSRRIAVHRINFN